MTADLRPLGRTNLSVTPVAMGCWPISGITSVDVTREHSLATLRAAFDSGVNFFDTAYSYGYDGESERLIAEALGDVRDRIVIASKSGLQWDADHKQFRDARPATIRSHCEESLRRLRTDRIDLYYLHAPDPKVPLAESAGAFRELLDAGKILSVGVSNFDRVTQYEEFQAVCPITADQPAYNMLQREIEADRLPWCRAHGVSVMPYWPLMKGFLAGKLARDHVWDPRDGRQKYPVFQGATWDRTHDFLDQLRPVAADAGLTLAQLVIAWTILQPGITSALCGAKRPAQIEETAQAMRAALTPEQLRCIDAALSTYGPAPQRPAMGS